MDNQEKKKIIQSRIDDLREWQKDLPEGKDFQELINKFESLLKELE